MKAFISAVSIFLCFVVFQVKAQEKTQALTVTVEIAESVKNKLKSKGRLLLFIVSNKDVEPRQMTWPSPSFQISCKCSRKYIQ